MYEDPSDNQEAEETKTKFMKNLKVTRNDFWMVFKALPEFRVVTLIFQFVPIHLNR